MIVPKSISSHSFKTMFTIMIIIIIIEKFHASAWPSLQDDASQLYVVPFSNLSGGSNSVMQYRSPRSGSSTLVVTILNYHKDK